MTTITQADRYTAQGWYNDVNVPLGLVEAFARHREATEARAREEVARAMQEAVLAIMSFTLDNVDKHRIRALDPAQIVGGGK